MNVCYISHSFSYTGGTKSYISNNALLLAAQGHNVHIVAPEGFNEKDFTGFKNRIFCHEFKMRKQTFKGAWHLEKFLPLEVLIHSHNLAKFLPEFIKEHQIDIIECPDYLPYLFFYTFKNDIPLVIRLHGYPGIQYGFDRSPINSWIKNIITWAILRSQAKNADLITSVSDFYAGLVRKKWDLKTKKIITIPIGIDFSLFKTNFTTRIKNSMIFVGRLSEAKGIKVLENALPVILKEYPDLEVYFAGHDLKVTDMKITFSKYFIEKFRSTKIIYLGSLTLKDLTEYYNKMSVCVCPSLYESGGTVALEAMTCGCPVIVTKQGGFIENIIDNETGLMVPVGDTDALANAVIRIFNSSELRERLSTNALKYVKGRFSLDTMVESTMNAYTKAITEFKAKR